MSAKARNSMLIDVPVLLLLSTGPLFALTMTAQDLFQSVSPSVVTIVALDANGNEIRYGNGFFIDEGVVVAYDESKDLAILSVSYLDARSLVLGDSQAMAVGDEIYVIGSPRGLEGTLSQGIVSGFRRLGQVEIMQITAPISPGSSGGPIINHKGEIVGVAFLSVIEGQNLNFALPVSHVLTLLDQAGFRKDVPAPDGEKPLDSQVTSSVQDLQFESALGYFARVYDLIEAG